MTKEEKKSCSNCKHEDVNYHQYPCNTCKYTDDSNIKLLWEPKIKKVKEFYHQL